jgi:hypothetical protein
VPPYTTRANPSSFRNIRALVHSCTDSTMVRRRRGWFARSLTEPASTRCFPLCVEYTTGVRRQSRNLLHRAGPQPPRTATSVRIRHLRLAPAVTVFASLCPARALIPGLGVAKPGRFPKLDSGAGCRPPWQLFGAREQQRQRYTHKDQSWQQSGQSVWRQSVRQPAWRSTPANSDVGLASKHTGDRVPAG